MVTVASNIADPRNVSMTAKKQLRFNVILQKLCPFLIKVGFNIKRRYVDKGKRIMANDKPMLNALGLIFVLGVSDNRLYKLGFL
jgi:hypothetical protein